MKKTLILVVLIAVLVGCKPLERIVEREKIVYKTEYKNTVSRDSIYLHDSTYIHQRGDTVFVSKWKTAYKYVLRHDTVMTADSVYIEVPYVVEVPKIEYRQNGIQKLLTKTGVISLLIAFAFGLLKIIKWKLKN